MTTASSVVLDHGARPGLDAVARDGDGASVEVDIRTEILDGQPERYGLGLAWGAELTPNVEAEVMLATRDTLESALCPTVN
jgi:hypothetical protein